MDAPRLNFGGDLADVTAIGPTGEPRPPISGRTSGARRSSATGAAVAAQTWTLRQAVYLDLLERCGPLTDHEAAALLNVLVGSVNSVRGALIKRGVAITNDSYQLHRFTDLAGNPQTTERARWRRA